MVIAMAKTPSVKPPKREICSKWRDIAYPFERWAQDKNIPKTFTYQCNKFLKALNQAQTISDLKANFHLLLRGCFAHYQRRTSVTENACLSVISKLSWRPRI